MNHHGVHFKVHLRSTEECRRFTVDDESVVTSFIWMKEKLKSVFPNLQNVPFKITWLDLDNDHITISSDEDLFTAFMEMPGIKTLHITITDEYQKQDEPDVQNEIPIPPMCKPRVICDICNAHITGFRYKCMVCPDYDLCAACEQKGNHAEHIMMRLAKGEIPIVTRKLMSYLGRSIRKATATASKEAHKASKFCSKMYEKEHSRFHGRGHHSRAPRCGENPSTSAAEVCPMMAGLDLGNLAAMASPFLEAIQRAAQDYYQPPAANATPKEASSNGNNNEANAANASANTNNNENNGNNTPNNGNANASAKPPVDDPLGNLIKNVMSNFFDLTVSPNNGAQEQSSYATPDTSNTPQNTPSTPMDVEQQNPKPNSIYPQVPEEKLEKAPEPGWTFLNTQEGKTSGPNSTDSSNPTAPNEEDPKIIEGLKQLREMGFSDMVGLAELLKRYNGDVGSVVKYIFDNY